MCAEPFYSFEQANVAHLPVERKAGWIWLIRLAETGLALC